LVGGWWLTPVILTTQEAEIRRIAVQIKKKITKIGLVEWLKVKAPSSNSSTTHTHKKN
jgi:hypothetical protein